MFLHHGVIQLSDGAVGDDGAAIHDVKDIGERLGEIEVLLDEQDADAGLLLDLHQWCRRSGR